MFVTYFVLGILDLINNERGIISIIISDVILKTALVIK